MNGISIHLASWRLDNRVTLSISWIRELNVHSIDIYFKKSHFVSVMVVAGRGLLVLDKCRGARLRHGGRWRITFFLFIAVLTGYIDLYLA